MPRAWQCCSDFQSFDDRVFRHHLEYLSLLVELERIASHQGFADLRLYAVHPDAAKDHHPATFLDVSKGRAHHAGLHVRGPAENDGDTFLPGQFPPPVEELRPGPGHPQEPAQFGVALETGDDEQSRLESPAAEERQPGQRGPIPYPVTRRSFVVEVEADQVSGRFETHLRWRYRGQVRPGRGLGPAFLCVELPEQVVVGLERGPNGNRVPDGRLDDLPYQGIGDGAVLQMRGM